MFKFLFVFMQFVLLLIIATFAIQNSKPVSFQFNDIIVTTSTSIIIVVLLFVITILLIFQRFIFFLKQTKQKYNFYREISTHKKGYNSFLKGMIALANKDLKKAVLEARNVNKYMKEETLSLLLKSETFKIEKKFDELNNVYEKMLKNPDTILLGYRGLMEQYLKAQDYHHAFIYGEKLYYLNPHIDKLYDTLTNIISKTSNWHKLLEINENALKAKIINHKVYSENNSIAYYEIAKIKYLDSESESIKLMEKAISLKENFPPYICFYVQLLININNLQKAKKILIKAWTNFPHPDLKNEIKTLAKKLNMSLYDLSKKITSNIANHKHSILLLTESLIEEEKWQEAKNEIKSLLEHKPTKDVCMLMAKIEEGDSGDPQKINSWVSRSNFGQISNLWVCSISGLSQNNWTSVSLSGHFNTLIWEKPKLINELQSPQFELNPNNYIEN